MSAPPQVALRSQANWDIWSKLVRDHGFLAESGTSATFRHVDRGWSVYFLPPAPGRGTTSAWLLSDHDGKRGGRGRGLADLLKLLAAFDGQSALAERPRSLEIKDRAKNWWDQAPAIGEGEAPVLADGCRSLNHRVGPRPDVDRYPAPQQSFRVVLGWGDELWSYNADAESWIDAVGSALSTVRRDFPALLQKGIPDIRCSNP